MVTSEKHCGLENGSSKKKVKKHKKLKTIKAQVSSEPELSKTKLKKKRLKYTDVGSIIQDLEVEQSKSPEKCRQTENSTAVTTAKKIKKHKKKREVNALENIAIENVTNENDAEKGFKHGDTSANGDMDIIKDEQHTSQKTKKRIKKLKERLSEKKKGLKNGDTNGTGALEMKDEKHILHKPKKRKKKSKETISEKNTDILKTNPRAKETCGPKDVDESDITTSKKRKRKHSDFHCDKNTEAIDCAIAVEVKKLTSKKKLKKSKRVRQEVQCSSDELTIVGKPPNATEIQLDQEKFHESGTQVANDKESLSATTQTNHVGQWSNSSFENKSTQEKFMRLMGGRKAQCNSNVGTLWSKPSLFSTTARSGVQYQNVSKDLENQYDAALSFNLQKRNEKNLSKGLGFKEDPAKGKKFYIDIKKSNSIKFED